MFVLTDVAIGGCSMRKWGYLALLSIILSGCGQNTIEYSESTGIQVGMRAERGWHFIVNSINSSFSGAEKHGDGVMIYATFPIFDSDPSGIPVPGDESLRKVFVGTPRNDGIGIQQGWFAQNEKYTGSAKVRFWRGHRTYIDVLGKIHYKDKNNNSLTLGDKVKGKPAMSSGNLNRLDVFARSDENQLVVISSKDNGQTWGYWHYLGDILTSDPVVASLGSNHLDVFVRRNDNRLWHKWWNGHRWSSWLDLGGTLKSNPVVAKRNGKLDVIAYHDDNKIWRKTFNGRRWLEWKYIGAGPSQANTSSVLSAVAVDDKRLMIFADNHNGEINYKVFNVSGR